MIKHILYVNDRKRKADPMMGLEGPVGMVGRGREVGIMVGVVGVEGWTQWCTGGMGEAAVA